MSRVALAKLHRYLYEQAPTPSRTKVRCAPALGRRVPHVWDSLAVAGPAQARRDGNAPGRTPPTCALLHPTPWLPVLLAQKRSFVGTPSTGRKPGIVRARPNPSSEEVYDRLSPLAENAIAEGVKVIESLLKDISVEVTNISAAADLMDEEFQEDSVVKSAVRGAVSRRMEEFSADITSVIDAYAQAKLKAGDKDVAAVLVLIKEEILAQLRSYLPPEVQVLELLTREPEPMKRILILEKVFDPHQSPDRDELEAPPCAPEALDLCIGQMINDMEDAIMVLDMRLLAQLCLCREEIRRVGKVAPSAAQLPERSVVQMEVTLLKTLMAVRGDLAGNAGFQRCALLKKAFLEGQALQGQPGDTMVRPGRFMETLYNVLYGGLLKEEIPDDKMRQRVLDIRRDGLLVLEEISRGDFDRGAARDFSVSFDKDMPSDEGVAGGEVQQDLDEAEREALRRLLDEIQQKGSL